MKKEIDSRDKISLQNLILRILIILSVFTLGGLVSMLIVNRLLDAHFTIYGETYMAESTAILDIMDNLLPYLGSYTIAFVILTLAVITVWFWAKVPMRYRLYWVAVLALVFVIVVGWRLSGQGLFDSTTLMMTPTPMP
jgi:hypothetical protein